MSYKQTKSLSYRNHQTKQALFRPANYFVHSLISTAILYDGHSFLFPQASSLLNVYFVLFSPLELLVCMYVYMTFAKHHNSTPFITKLWSTIVPMTFAKLNHSTYIINKTFYRCHFAFS